LKKQIFLKNLKLGIGVVSLITFLLAATVIWWGTPVFDMPYRFDEYALITGKPPYDFVTIDKAVEKVKTRIEQAGLSSGEIDPYLHRYGNMESRYASLVQSHEEIHQLALVYPDSASANSDTTFSFRNQAKRVISLATAITPNYLGLYQLYHQKKWWGILFFVSIYGMILGIITVSRDEFGG
jgi:hypothetical protein